MGPMAFQERIAQIMEGLNWNYVLAYIEDIISITKGDYENHFEVLQQVLERLHKYRLRLRRDKCSFVCKEVEYQVSTVGIAPQYEYLDRIRAWPKPKSRDELRACLGVFPSLSMFSPCTSSVLRPLQSLLGKKRSMSDWSSEHDKCFEASKLLFEGQELVHSDDIWLPLKCTLMPVLMDLGEFLFRMTNQFGVYLHR